MHAAVMPSARWSAAAVIAAASAAVLAGEAAPVAPPSARDQASPIEWTAKDDHQHMLDRLGITTLRRGADGMNPRSPYYQNTDESKADPWPDLPDPLTLKNGRKVTTAEEWWSARRPEIVEDFDREVYGRVPEDAPKVNWEVASATEGREGDVPVITKRLIGRADNSSCREIEVAIQLSLTTPAGAAGPVPVMMEFGFSFGGFGGGGFGGGGPSWQQQVLAKGWGYAILSPTSVQADSGSGLRKGIIGLCNKGQPRKPDDWGALRAWAWGASRALDYLETDEAVDATQVGIEGLSRYGKAALVAMAYDRRFAIGFIGSSGAGGAKLHRRNFGELVENLTGSGEYHWMAGNFLKYGGPLNAGDLPVDAHELIALCAPRPTFISYGASTGRGAEGTWVDQKGSFMAAAAAGCVFRLLGKKDLGTSEFPPVETALVDGELAFRQHGGGHTNGPNWPAFLEFAERYIKSPRPHAAGKLNILFLFADDQRADTIAAHGNPHIRTPNLDTLAGRGFSFRGNYVCGGNSGAVCVPSRAMLMSGKTWFRVNTASLEGAKLLPELLGEHGYATFGTGKWHNGQKSWLRAFRQGRNIFFGGMSDHTRVPVRDLGPDGALTAERTGEKISSELFADAAIEFLERRDAARPFFAYVAFTAPHDPRMPPVPYREAYYRDLPPLPANFRPQLPFDNGMMRGGRDENLAPWPRTEAVIRAQLAEYYGLITHLDEQVGRILAALERTGAADSTVVVYAADNGLALGSHGLLGKQSVYEHSMRVPMIFAGPGIPRGKSTEAFTYLLDVFPTLCDIAGIAPPPDLDGESLRPLWEGTKERVRDSVFLPFIQIQRAVRDERWKLVCYPKIGYLELFDLGADPHETTNLIDRPENAGHVRRLFDLMRRWQAEVGDTLALPTESTTPEKVDLTGRKREPDQWQPEWIRKKYFEAAPPDAGKQ